MTKEFVHSDIVFDRVSELASMIENARTARAVKELSIKIGDYGCAAVIDYGDAAETVKVEFGNRWDWESKGVEKSVGCEASDFLLSLINDGERAAWEEKISNCYFAHAAGIYIRCNNTCSGK